MIRFSKDHEYIRVDGDIGTVGITDYAQSQLGDVVFVDLPPVGKTLEAGAEAAVVESVKAASEVYAPVAGAVVAVNEALTSNPGAINESAMDEGWFLKLKIADTAALDGLMNQDEYDAYLKSIS